MTASALALGIAATVPMAVPDATAKESRRYPGIPQIYERDYDASANDVQATAVGLGKSGRAKQYFRLPVTTFRAMSVMGPGVVADGTCTQAPPFKNISDFEVPSWAASPPGSPKPLGYFPLVTVRSVAFGSIPVEATIELSQVIRPEDGLPEPLFARTKSKNVCLSHLIPAEYQAEYGHRSPQESYITDSTMSGRLSVRVTRLSVDGVEVPVGSSCRTRTPAQLDLRGESWWTGDVPAAEWPQAMYAAGKKTSLYHALEGGLLQGSVTLPPFEGCVSNGEDVSPVLTATVSGDDNPVTAYQSPAMTYATCPAGNTRDYASILECAGSAEPYDVPSQH